MTSPERYVIIVAAGAGTRFGGERPKQFLDLGGKPVCVRAAECFMAAIGSPEIIFALPADGFDGWRSVVDDSMAAGSRVTYVKGGATRWESVKNALAAIPSDAAPGAAVLIHDGARPLVDTPTIRRVCGAVINTDGAIPAIPVTDSLRRIGDDGVTSEPVDRADFRAVQTPQGFALWRLRQAYALPYEKSFTDDASVMAAAGFTNIVLVAGSPDNIKITNPRDLKIAGCLICGK